MSGNVELPEAQLAQSWRQVDWQAAEARLAELQARLARAALARDHRAVRALQAELMGDLMCRCLAVRKVCSAKSGPGVDGVRWRTDAERMRAAIELDAATFRASPQRQVIITARNTGKRRRVRIGTWHDRAMASLAAWTLLPVTEATADKKSFAFRKGRSAFDAQEYVLKGLCGRGAPEFVVVADIRSYYATIQHAWLLAHVPMDKHVLSELLACGYVFASELFPSGDVGISESSGLSPALGNFVLDGMQRAVYRALWGDGPIEDYANGNLVRYADDVVVTARDPASAHVALEAIRGFLADRGLALSPDKTKVVSVDEGFTFLSRSYVRKGRWILTSPSEAAVERFCTDLASTIAGWKRSQRELIAHLNRKLRGWASYHRYSEAGAAFREVDACVQSALVEAARRRHPKMKVRDLLDLYWYEEPDGSHSYALPDDKTVKVVKLAGTVLAHHRRVRLSENPYTDRAAIEAREAGRARANVAGPWKAVWERQEGRCAHCGGKMLVDQPKDVVRRDPKGGDGPGNAAYIHASCAFDEVEELLVTCNAGLGRYDAVGPLEDIERELEGEMRPLPDTWKYLPLKEFFAGQTAASVTLTFSQIEKLLGFELPPSARERPRWWRKEGWLLISRAWQTEGYELARVSPKKETARFSRAEDGTAHLEVPPQLTRGKLPDNAVFELERFFDYVIGKYGL